MTWWWYLSHTYRTMIHNTHEAVPGHITHCIWTGHNVDEVVEMTKGFYNLSVSHPSQRLNAGAEILAHLGWYVVLRTTAGGQWRLEGFSPENFATTFRERAA